LACTESTSKCPKKWRAKWKRLWILILCIFCCNLGTLYVRTIYTTSLPNTVIFRFFWFGRGQERKS
jgi:hypothetical protein